MVVKVLLKARTLSNSAVTAMNASTFVSGNSKGRGDVAVIHP